MKFQFLAPPILSLSALLLAPLNAEQINSKSYQVVLASPEEQKKPAPEKRRAKKKSSGEKGKLPPGVIAPMNPKSVAFQAKPAPEKLAFG